MNINRHNYEEYFLLYADGELSAIQKTSVEHFIAANPDLEQELILLLNSKIPIDTTVSFSHKHLLYKSQIENISLENMEESLLLYIDDELNETDKAKTELLIRQNTNVQESLSIFQKTKLEKESIIFPDKKYLYKKDTPVIGIVWKNILAAAVIIGCLVLAWNIFKPTKETLSNNLAVVAKNNSAPNFNQQQLSTKTIVSATNNSKENDIKPSISTNKKTNSIKNPFRNNRTNKPESIITTNMQIVSSEKAINQTIALSTHYEKIESLKNNEPTYTNSSLKEKGDLIAQQTVYKTLDTDEEENTNNVYIGNIKVNKTKLKGFMRMAKGLFSSNNNEEDKIAIASFTISKSLK